MSGAATTRFLITRLSAFGDCIQSIPMLCALRDHFPSAEIYWLAQQPMARFLESHADLTGVIAVRRHWLKYPREILRIRKQLRSLRLDVVIDPQSLSKSAFAGWLCGAGRRIGLARPKGREAALFLNNELVHPAQLTVERYLRMLEPLEIHQREPTYRIPFTVSAERKTRAFMKINGLQEGYVILNPGAGWASKRWPEYRYTILARWLFRSWGLRSVVQWHGDNEKQMALRIVAASQRAAVMSPDTDLTGLASILRSARLFVGSDTGPLHLAAAVDVPCVSMFGTTRKEENAPAGPHHIAIQKFYQGGTTKARKRAPNTAMKTISVEDVRDACESLLRKNMHDLLRPSAADFRDRLARLDPDQLRGHSRTGTEG